MRARRRRWHSQDITLGRAMALMGCATGDQTFRGLNARPEQHLGVGLIMDPSRDGNSTDWSLWMDSQGGG